MKLDIKIKIKGEYVFPCNVMVKFRRTHDIGYNYHVPDREFEGKLDILKYLAENLESDTIEITVKPVRNNNNY